MYFIVLLILGILILLGLSHFSLARIDGAVLLGTDGSRYDIELWQFIVLFVLTMALTYIAIQLIITLLNLPKYLKKAHQKRKSNRSENYRNRALQDIILGNWDEAESHFKKASNYISIDLYHLMAAMCAIQAGHTQQAKNYLNQLNLPEYERWIRDVLELDCMIQMGHLQSALDRVLFMVKETGEPATIQRLIEVCFLMNNWAQASEHMDEIVAWFNRHLGKPSSKEWVRSMMKSLKDNPSEFKKVYRMLSIQLQHDVVIETINADFINRSISSKAKLDYIENVCRRNLDPKLVKSYSKSIIDPARMIKQAVSWQEKSPDMPEIHLLLARCNRHQEVFDAALDHYNKYLMV